MEKIKANLKKCLLISIISGILASIAAFVISWSNPSGDDPRKIKQVEQEIQKLCVGIGKETEFINNKTGNKFNATPLCFSWQELENITTSLIYENEKIAKAKALTYCKANPIPEYSFWTYLWNEKEKISSSEWKIQTVNSQILTDSGIALLCGIGSLSGIFVGLIVLFWVWYFLLERISELSRSIQGK